MIKEFEQHHGAVLTRLIHGANQLISVEQYPSKSNASYVINGQFGIYIKHCKSRLSPWRFSFAKQHQDDILRMKNHFDSVFVVFVCHTDGIVALSFEELKVILDHEHEEWEWVAIQRRPRQKYTVSGSDGALPYKIGESDFPAKIFATDS